MTLLVVCKEKSILLFGPEMSAVYRAEVVDGISQSIGWEKENCDQCKYELEMDYNSATVSFSYPIIALPTRPDNPAHPHSAILPRLAEHGNNASVCGDEKCPEVASQPYFSSGLCARGVSPSQHGYKTWPGKLVRGGGQEPQSRWLVAKGVSGSWGRWVLRQMDATAD